MRAETEVLNRQIFFTGVASARRIKKDEEGGGKKKSIETVTDGAEEVQLENGEITERETTEGGRRRHFRYVFYRERC